MVVAVGAVLVTLLVRRHIFAKSLFTLLADEDHLSCFCKLVLLRLCVTLGAVIPLLAAWCSDGDLGIKDVFADRSAQRFGMSS